MSRSSPRKMEFSAAPCAKRHEGPRRWAGTFATGSDSPLETTLSLNSLPDFTAGSPRLRWGQGQSFISDAQGPAEWVPFKTERQMLVRPGLQGGLFFRKSNATIRWCFGRSVSSFIWEW